MFFNKYNIYFYSLFLTPSSSSNYKYSPSNPPKSFTHALHSTIKAKGPYFEPKSLSLDDYLITKVLMALKTPFQFQRGHVCKRIHYRTFREPHISCLTSLSIVTKPWCKFNWREEHDLNKGKAFSCRILRVCTLSITTLFQFFGYLVLNCRSFTFLCLLCMGQTTY